MRRLTQIEVIESIKKVHNDKYDLSKVVYVNRRTKICVICPIHGEWFTLTEQLLRGQGCFTCGKSLSGLKKRIPISEFLERVNIVHNNRYQYDLSEYKGIRSKIKIHCDFHDKWFSQMAHAHLDLAQGCPDCGVENQKLKRRMSLKVFIDKANIIHDNKYDYSAAEQFENQNSLVTIICPKHGPRKVLVGNHLGGSGCNDCNTSRGEEVIKAYLKSLELNFNAQHIFKGLKDVRNLRCDFYIESLNLVIEFNGRQHYEPVGAFGGEKSLKEVQRRDKIKKEFCKNNNIRFEVINFNDNIKSKIDEYLRKYQT
jgi:very-short-patch-repair endonuclease